jgi:hypothetical protein
MRYLLGLLTPALLVPAAPAAVVAVGNFTDHEIAFTVADTVSPIQSVKIPAYQVVPVAVAGPADLTYATTNDKQTVRVEAYNGYGFIPDPASGIRLEGIELPGDPPERDAKPDPDFKPRQVLKVPVTLMLEDSDQRADANWQPDLRERFMEAAAAVEAAAGVRFEFAGFARWRVDPAAKDLSDLLGDFETKVTVKPEQLAVGWTSKAIEEKPDAPVPFGATRGLPTRHVLMRDSRLRDKSERTEVLTHYLAMTLGAVPIGDPGSVMRPSMGDGRARLKGFTFRFDPLNVLAMNIWAEELRRGPLESAGQASAANRIRLTRVYRALVKASPGSNSDALGYLNDFDKEIGGDSPPKKR